jgi:hypothetical protein
VFSVELHRKGVPAPSIQKSNIQTIVEAEQFAASILQEPRIVGLESVVILENGNPIRRIPAGTL